MAKKRTAPRRAPRSTTPRTFGDGMPSKVAERVAPSPAPARTPVAPAMRRPASPSRGASVVRSQEPLRVEYGHVGRDLRLLGAVSVMSFVVMIVLGFVIR
jgi:hypothetical protein